MPSKLLIFVLYTILVIEIGHICTAKSVYELYRDDNDNVSNNHVTAHHRSKRIVGGTDTTILRHPYQISMRLMSESCPFCYDRHVCSGSILAASIVVTAAHCVVGKVPKQYRIIAGTSLLHGSDGLILSVEKIIIHEHFVLHNYTNDIALLYLHYPLQLNNKTIKAIELYENIVQEGTMVTISGWGKTNHGLADSLQEIQVPVINDKLCAKDFKPEHEFIDGGMMCAGLQSVGGKDACNGDSGGPLVIDNKLAGIVSWGLYCADPRFPGVYTRISHFLPWLREKMAEYKPINPYVRKLLLNH